MVDRANCLINMVLMNARGDLDNKQGDYALFSVRRCIEDALQVYPFRAGERELVRLSGPDFQAWGSDILFSYVIYNLLKNALDARKTAEEGEVSIHLEPEESHGRIRFRDNGSGIAPEILPHIFDQFFTDKKPGTGSGMGLSFCKQVVTGFGGDIRCRSRQGAYTEFEIILPRSANGDDAR